MLRSLTFESFFKYFLGPWKFYTLKFQEKKDKLPVLTFTSNS